MDDAKKLQWLMDRMEIQDLLNAYARGIDHGDPDLIRQVYHDGAIDEHGIFSGEGDAFAAFTVAANPRRFRMMQHHHTTTSIDIRGDEAEAETYFLCVCRTHEGELHFSSGRTADQLARRDGRWAVARRQVIMDWTLALPEPDASPNDAKFLKGRLDMDDASRSLLPRLLEGGFFGARLRR